MKTKLHQRWIWLGLAAVLTTLLQGAGAAQEPGDALDRAQDERVASNTVAADLAAGIVQDELQTNATAPFSPAPAEDLADSRRSGQRTVGELVVFGHNVKVNTNEAANDIVVIFGTATIRGSARDAVAIFGNIIVEGGEVGDAVAVLGNVRLGTNSTVQGDAVAVAGGVSIGPGSKVSGDAVAVGGGVEQAEGAEVGGDVVGLEGFGWVGEYVEHCVLKLRPLAPGLPWLWAVTGVIGLLYLLIAVVFTRPLTACATELSTRPATAFLVGLLTKFLLAPLVTLVLALTGIGVVLIPFLSAAMLFAGVLGKIALLQFVGQRIGRQTGVATLEKPVVGFLVGWLILTGLYMVPIVGWVMMTVTGIWALGAAVMALFGGSRKELPQPPLAAATPLSGAASTGSTASPAEPGAGTTASVPRNPMSGEFLQPVPSNLPGQESGAAMGAEMLTSPRASFWERMAAGFLDLMLVAILSGLIGGGPFGLLVALAYFSGMWAWRGTTIGGIVLNLKVVRYDGQTPDFAVALVRSLMAAFSLIVCFLGFLWIAFTPDRQAWHDKIAGTLVVRRPKGMPLLCL